MSHLKLAARVRVSGPTEPDKWAPFDVSHPIEGLRFKKSLGTNEAEASRRYKAARLWSRLYDRAHPCGSAPEMGERVDTSGSTESGVARYLDATHERIRAMTALNMTVMTFSDLDAICGMGKSFRSRGRDTYRHHSSVRQAVMGALDAVAGHSPWQRLLDAEPALWLEPIPRRKKAT